MLHISSIYALALSSPHIDARSSGCARFDQQIGTNLRQGRATADPHSIIDRCQLGAGRIARSDRGVINARASIHAKRIHESERSWEAHQGAIDEGSRLSARCAHGKSCRNHVGSRFPTRAGYLLDVCVRDGVIARARTCASLRRWCTYAIRRLCTCV